LIIGLSFILFLINIFMVTKKKTKNNGVDILNKGVDILIRAR
jgi:galactitol-specific phosphotransferase system IIC component